MRTSEQIDLLAAALAAAQLEMESASKDATNPHFKSKYATLASVWDACRGPLGKNGLAVIQSPSTTEQRYIRITTRLMHKSGQWLEDELDIKPAKDDAQGAGSAISYGRRYTLSSLVGIVTDDDDDGNAASMAPKKPQAKPVISKAPEVYDMHSPQCKSWLSHRVITLRPDLSREAAISLCSKINAEIHNLCLDSAATFIVSAVGVLPVKNNPEGES